MLKSRFLWQVWAVLGVTFMIPTAVFSFLVVGQVERDALARIERNLLDQALALSPGMLPYLESGTRLTPEQVTELTPGIKARITLIASDGLVLADNRQDAAGMDNHGAKPEVRYAKTAPFGVSQRFSSTLSRNMLYLSVRLAGTSGKVGFLRLGLPLTPVEEQVDALRLGIGAVAVAIGVLCLLAGSLLAYRVTDPIARMTEVARDIARGEYHPRVATGRKDEFGRLALAINELALGVQQRIDDLTASRNELEAVLAGLTEGVIAFDADQRVIHINDAALDMLSLERDVVGVEFPEVPTAREIKRSVEACITEGTGIVSTANLDGRILEFSAVLMHGTREDEAGALLVLEDVTERRRLEQVRSDFVANASHELKTPIAAILGLVETIIDDPKMPADVFARFVKRVREQTIGLDTVVQGLLKLSRFDSAPGEGSLIHIDMTGLVRQVYQARGEDARDADVALELDIQVDTLRVEGEAEGLNQMLTNLVDNAIKYTGPGGKVQLRLLEVSSMARVEVEDNGMGISKDETERIFERFYRVDRARSREKGGTGLGLAIVKHIAQAHGGRVSVESRLGTGSMFIVQLPLANMGPTRG